MMRSPSEGHRFRCAAFRVYGLGVHERVRAKGREGCVSEREMGGWVCERESERERERARERERESGRERARERENKREHVTARKTIISDSPSLQVLSTKI